MKVSIIIPVYNAEKYLQECIESALNQTYSDIEVITVNDGSTDDSLQILKKYDGRIKVITKENGGAASAMNAGIKQATGEWIKRLDADDVLYPNAIEELITEAKNLKGKTHTILYANFDYINSEGKIIRHSKEPNYNDLSSFEANVILLDHHIGNEDTTLIHNSIFKDYGMYREKDFEDYELRLRFCILNSCRLHLVSKTVAKYRLHPVQTTKIKMQNSLRKTDQIRESILEKLDPNERKKYQIALKQYKKNKPLAEKWKYFVRYNIFPILPQAFSKKLVNMYWYARKR
jgi:glycosyltransferase involved in cell wall biosynthesis